MKIAFTISLFLANTAHAAMLSTIALPLPSGASGSSLIGFGVAEQFGPGTWFSVEDSVLDRAYDVPEVALMYSLVNDAVHHSKFGPPRVRAQSGDLIWVNSYDAMSYTHSDDAGYGGAQTCCAQITGSLSVLDTPWAYVTLTRSLGAITARVYDTPVPETNTTTLTCMLVWLISVEIRLQMAYFRRRQ